MEQRNRRVITLRESLKKRMQTTPAHAPGREIVREARPVMAFNQVTLHGVGQLSITQGTEVALNIEAPAHILPQIKSRITDSRLTLRITLRGSFRLVAVRQIHYHLTVRDLTQLTLFGSATVTIDALQTDQLSTSIRGAGKVVVAGSAGLQRVSIFGTGRYDGTELTSRRAEVQIDGTGYVLVRVAETLDVRMAGAGAVRFIGSPQVRQTIWGTGSVNALTQN